MHAFKSNYLSFLLITSFTFDNVRGEIIEGKKNNMDRKLADVASEYFWKKTFYVHPINVYRSKN